MPISQNVLFQAAQQPDETNDHPPGSYIARAIKDGLDTDVWALSELENWRDCGWYFTCVCEGASLQVAVAQALEGQWLVQIAPARVPGLIGRLFKGKASARAPQTLSLAKAVHAILESDDLFSGFQWCWDGFPGEQNTTEKPVAFGDS